MFIFVLWPKQNLQKNEETSIISLLETKHVKITKLWNDEESVWASEERWRESETKGNTNNWMMRSFLFLSVFNFLFSNTEWQERKRESENKEEAGKLENWVGN